MFRVNFRLSLRSLLKNKLYSFINISGLAVGLASAILICLWIQSEVSHDRFHPNIDRLYLLNNRDQNNGGVYVWNYTCVPLGPAIQKDYPEVERAVRVNNSGANFLISAGDKHFSIHGNFVDTGFFSLFNFPLLEGNPSTALNSVKNIVLTQQLARKLFGNEDPMGRTVRVDSVDYLTVTGVLKDLPANTSFQFDYLLPFSYFLKIFPNGNNNWGNSNLLTFVTLKPGVPLAEFDKKVANIIISHLKPGEATNKVFAQPYKDAWLYSKAENGQYVGGRIELVRMFILIAVFILVIACINFTNLSTARSEKRAREVGIRKVSGALRSSLIVQFIGESILLALIAGILSVGIVQLCLPGFNEVVGTRLSIDYGNPWYWMWTLLFVVLTGVLAGIYPAFYLSSFQPVKVLKGSFKPVKALLTPRKILVVLQFTFAIALIICTIIVEGQIRFAENRDAGYRRDNLAFLIMFGDARKNYELIKKGLLSSGAATAVAQTSAPMTESWGNSNGFIWKESNTADTKSNFNLFSADEDFSATMNLQVLQGRNIDYDRYKTDSTAVLLNETAVKMMRLKHPIGEIIRNMYGGPQLHVIGVIKDFILENPYEPVAPMIIAGPVMGYMVVNFRINEHPSYGENLAKAERVFTKYNPQYPFNVRFYDKEYELKFADELRVGTLVGLFASLTIFISCLGLFGLVAYMAESRIKEIGIRKVLGASVTNIAGLLSKEFLRLVCISFVIASPIAWLVMHKWLASYSYRIAIEWWVFVVTGFVSLVIALATVSFQAVRAALANPVRNLRTE
ncbi:ABC transporter permease [Puia dinghuensis]|uniref:ABC transporter permease n=1 Tax=Puia dinghuensis TaxID=1792502 RepID=A0A8J2UHL0_9BACT|nr:ABC transporter permease [Puia dinghuensis]GGB18725.1 ABC transporter permease [Puia dinghuensis]